MSRSHSTRKTRESGRNSSRYDESDRHGGFATEPRRYIDDSAYERPRDYHRRDNRSRHDYDDDSYHRDERRRDRRPYDDGYSGREGRHSTRDHHHDTPGRRSRTPRKSARHYSNGALPPPEGPLRRQSTQPPHRRASASPAATPGRHHRGEHNDDTQGAYRRRDVEPHVSARRQRPASPPRDNSRALVVVGDASHSVSPCREHRHRTRGESADGVVDSPRRPAGHHRADPSPRRSSRGPGATPQPSKGSERDDQPLRSRSTRRREPESARRSHRDRPSHRDDAALAPQSTGRYVSPPDAHRQNSPRRARSSRRHRPVDEVTPRRSSRGGGEDKDRDRGHRTSSRPRPRETSQKTASRPSSRHGRRESTAPREEESTPAPRVPPFQPPTSTGSRGSTFLRPPSQLNSARGQPHASSSRRSSSGIEVIGISSRPFLSSADLVVSASPRRFEPIPTPPQVVQIREKISETKEWLEEMKSKVEKDTEREERHRSRPKQRHSSSATRHRTPSHKHRDPNEDSRGDATEDTRRSRGTHRSGSSRRPTQHATPDPVFQPPPAQRSSNRRLNVDSYPTSTTGTSDEPRLHPQQVPFSNKENSTRNSVNQRPHSIASSSRHAAAAPIPPSRPSPPPQPQQQQPRPPSTAGSVPATKPKSSVAAASNAASSVDRRVQAASVPRGAERKAVKTPSVRAVEPVARSKDEEQGMRAALEAANTTIEEDPIFSFPSFLDGNTFHTTAALCQYNMALAEALTDDQLDAMRAAVFDHDEVAFAEILYGDDIQAELALIETTLGHSDDPKVRYEMRRLQAAAVQRFTDKCTAARAKLADATECNLVEAIRRAGVGLERAPYGETDAMVAPY